MHCTRSPTPPTSMTAPSRPTPATVPFRCAIMPYLHHGASNHGASVLIAACALACLARLASMAGARHRWQIASARASAASAGRGRSVIRSSRITIVVTWSLSARPLPVTAALTSLGVCRATGSPRRAAQTIATAPGLRGAHHGPHVVLAEHPLHRHRVRLVLGQPALDLFLDRQQPGRDVRRRPSVRTTPTATRLGGRPGTPSTTPSPHRVRPGSTPSTRDGRRRRSRVHPVIAPHHPIIRSEHLFVRTLPARPLVSQARVSQSVLGTVSRDQAAGQSVGARSRRP